MERYDTKTLDKSVTKNKNVVESSVQKSFKWSWMHRHTYVDLVQANKNLKVENKKTLKQVNHNQNEAFVENTILVAT